MNYHCWLTQAIAGLTASESPKRDAEILLGLVTGRARTFILAFGETELEPAQQAALQQLLQRRQQGEPIAYLTGEREFWSLPLRVSPATLIPRPDTECLVEQALLRLPVTPCHVLDLGTGTGAIALALASERPDCQVMGIDCQPDAVALAQENAQRLGITNTQFVAGDWFSPLVGAVTSHFAIITSNPPYIDAADPHLAQGDVRFEPRSALVAEDEGLADLRTITQQAGAHLLLQGWLLLEHGWQQGPAVRTLLQQAGFQAVATCRDYAGQERVSLGQWRAVDSVTL